MVLKAFLLVLFYSLLLSSTASAGRLPNSPKEAGRTVVITERAAKPVHLKLVIDGEKRRITAAGNITVGECLKREGIDPDKFHVSEPLTETVKKGMIITLKSKTADELKKEQQDIEYVKRHPSITGRHHAGSGAHLVVQAGVQYVKDEAGSLHLIIGHHLMEATAYLPEDGTGDGITATGVPAAYGVAAVDPDVIPLGTRIFVPGYGIALAADTGGAIEGHIVDLCYEDYDEAIQFGRRDVDVYLLAV